MKQRSALLLLFCQILALWCALFFLASPSPRATALLGAGVASCIASLGAVLIFSPIRE